LLNQKNFHFNRRITPKRVTSLRCTSSRQWLCISTLKTCPVTACHEKQSETKHQAMERSSQRYTSNEAW